MSPGLGIKQPRRANVTGTIVMLVEDDANESVTPSNKVSHESEDPLSLKRTNTGIILHPQPQDNPNDPLNWPILTKDLCFLIIGFQTFLGGGQTPILAAGLGQLGTEFHKSTSTISYLVGGYMLALGFGSVFASPTAILYGKRLVYLLGIFLFLIGSIWAAASPSFGSLMGARILMAFGASPTESLASASLSELYFQHERAYRTGLYTMLLLGGKNIVPLLSGLVFQYLDRHWLFWILSIFLGVVLLLTFLFVPETFWDRSPTPNKRSIEESKAARAAKTYKSPNERPNAWALRQNSFYYNENDNDILSLPSTINDSHFVHLQHSGSDEVQAGPPMGLTNNDNDNDNEDYDTDLSTIKSIPKSYKEKLAVTSGRHTIDSWWMVALRPFYLYAYPSVLFGAFVYSLAVVWLIVISETISDIFEGDGYNYDQQSVGLFYIGPFVGGILGSLSAGIIGDRLTRLLVSKNNGIYEPEFRLVMLIPATFFISFGLMGFGWSSYEKDLWIGPVIFFGCVSFGCSIASTTAITFSVDSYKMFAAEALVTFNFTKNLLGFIFSLFNNRFYDKTDAQKIFVTYGGIQIFISLFGLPIYIYGKKLRTWTDDKEILKRLYHVDNAPSTKYHGDHEEKSPDTSFDNETANVSSADNSENPKESSKI